MSLRVDVFLGMNNENDNTLQYYIAVGNAWIKEYVPFHKKTALHIIVCNQSKYAKYRIQNTIS